MTAQISAYGRLVADVQSRTTNNDKPMAFSRMAVTLPCQKAENGEAIFWLAVTTFGRQAEALARKILSAMNNKITTRGGYAPDA